MQTLYFAAVVSVFFLLFSSPKLSGLKYYCLPYLYIWCGLSANLKCRSEKCYTRLARNAGRKNSQSAHHRTTLSSYIFAIKAYIDNRKKMLNSNIFSTCLHNMVNFSPLTVEICRWVWGTPANFNGFRVLASLLHRRRTTDVNQTLQDVRPSPGLLHYICISGALAP